MSHPLVVALHIAPPNPLPHSSVRPRLAALLLLKRIRSKMLGALRSAQRLQPTAAAGLLQLRWFSAAGNLQLIKQLREETGAPMTDVKKALEAVGWDKGAAVHLRWKAVCGLQRLVERRPATHWVPAA